MTPPPLAPRKKLSGWAIATIVAGVIVAVAVSGITALTLLLVREDLNVPGWVQYPHATPTTSGPKGVQSSTLEQIALRYQTLDSVENVAEYYKTEITRHGGRATTQAGDLERWGVHGIVVKDANGKLKVDIMRPVRQPTVIVINYWR